jgi:FAD-linked sulfhydryl oxidase
VRRDRGDLTAETRQPQTPHHHNTTATTTIIAATTSVNMTAAPRRFAILIAISLLISAFIFLSSSHGTPRATIAGALSNSNPLSRSTSAGGSSLPGKAIAPKLGNETAKAELGRASWKLFHTIMARFPDTPTSAESTALRDYVYLFQRLYPCGECAEHFGVILQKFPPQTSSRSAAAVWGCHVHNEVNKSLKKDLFDCSNIGDFYDCGCADRDDKDKTKG